MKEIPLTQGQVALVDDADYDWLMQWKWCAYRHRHTFYAVRSEWLGNGKQRTVLMHRVILGLEHGDKREADHINHNGLDNQRTNIRIVTRQENMFNVRSQGYSVRKRPRPFQVCITVAGRSKHIGYFATREEALAARRRAKRKYHHISGDCHD